MKKIRLNKEETRELILNIKKNKNKSYRDCPICKLELEYTKAGDHKYIVKF